MCRWDLETLAQEESWSYHPGLALIHHHRAGVDYICWEGIALNAQAATYC